MNCGHPDPKTVRWLFCRDCGYFVEGERMADATEAVLREALATETEQGAVYVARIEES